MKQLVPAGPKTPSLLIIAGGIMLSSVFCYPVAKAESMLPLTSTVRCLPDGAQSPVSNNAFQITRGQEIIFECTIIQSKDGKPFSATLMAKQNGGGQAAVISSTDITAPDTLPLKTTLRFPALFQKSDYLYSFSLINTETKQPMAREVTLLGALKDTAQSRISAASTDKSEYAWGDTITLKLTLVEGPTTPLYFDLSMPTAEGAVCAKLYENQPITKNEAAVSVVIPKDAGCANTLDIALKSEDKTVLDKKSLALNIATVEAPNESGSTVERPSWAIIGVALAFGVALLSLIGYLSFRKKN